MNDNAGVPIGRRDYRAAPVAALLLLAACGGGTIGTRDPLAEVPGPLDAAGTWISSLRTAVLRPDTPIEGTVDGSLCLELVPAPPLDAVHFELLVLAEPGAPCLVTGTARRTPDGYLYEAMAQAEPRRCTMLISPSPDRVRVAALLDGGCRAVFCGDHGFTGLAELATPGNRLPDGHRCASHD